MKIKRRPYLAGWLWGLGETYVSTWWNSWPPLWSGICITHLVLNYMPAHYIIHINILFYNVCACVSVVHVGVGFIFPATCPVLEDKAYSWWFLVCLFFFFPCSVSECLILCIFSAYFSSVWMDILINELMSESWLENSLGILPWNSDKAVGDLQKVSPLDPFK